MTARERIHSALSHREPDAVPVDLGSTPSSGISVGAYNSLKEELEMHYGKTKVYDVVQQLAEPEDEILRRFSVAAIDIARPWTADDGRWYRAGEQIWYPLWFRPEEGSDGAKAVHHQDGSRIAAQPTGATFFDQTSFPYLDGYPENFSELSQHMTYVPWHALVHSPWDQAGEEDFWNLLRSRTKKLREESDAALVVNAGCNLFEWGTFLRRIDNFLMDLYLEQAKVEALLDTLMEHHLNTLSHICEAVGDCADVIRLGDDLGMDSGPFMAPELYRKFFKPRHSMLCSFIKRNSSMRPLLHSCGSIYALLPDLIEAGFDAVNPVQTNVRNMEPERLKREFGKDISFWGGGADTRYVLNQADPHEVRNHVLRQVEVLSRDGGFVFAAIHNLMPDVPAKNILAMFNAVEEFNGK